MLLYCFDCGAGLVNAVDQGVGGDEFGVLALGVRVVCQDDIVVLEGDLLCVGADPGCEAFETGFFHD